MVVVVAIVVVAIVVVTIVVDYLCSSSTSKIFAQGQRDAKRGSKASMEAANPSWSQHQPLVLCSGRTILVWLCMPPDVFESRAELQAPSLCWHERLLLLHVGGTCFWYVADPDQQVEMINLEATEYIPMSPDPLSTGSIVLANIGDVIVDHSTPNRFWPPEIVRRLTQLTDWRLHVMWWEWRRALHLQRIIERHVDPPRDVFGRSNPRRDLADEHF